MGEQKSGPGNGPVVLDLGGDVGAALLVGEPDLAGMEVEIRADGTGWDGRHVGFHRRDTPDGQIAAAVFPGLVSGRWEVRLRRGDPGSAVPFSVHGGRVTTVSFPRFS